MSRRPVIALNADYSKGRKGLGDYSAVWAGYYDCLYRAGALPIILPPISDPTVIEEMLDRVDAVVLVGGADLDPYRDGYERHPSVRIMAPRREDFDRALVERIAERRLPVFGIGVGMQLLNVSQGGNLFLDIQVDLKNALPHWESNDPYHRHGLVVAAKSLLARVYGDSEIRVNSMHHMAIDEVARGFKVTARAPDGVIEAIESTREDWFAIGTQFHPEAESASALDFRIFEEFVEEVSRRSLSVRLAA